MAGGVRKKYTIEDMARELGVSKTTVSRALSGRGRIGAETAERVRRLAKEQGYRPNVLAQGLARNKTNNLGIVIPLEDTDVPFFKECLNGICEEAAAYDYDIIVSIAKENSLTQLHRLVMNNKVDGFILTRALVNSSEVQFLKEYGVPFLVIGPSSGLDVVSIDNPNREASRELTEFLLMKGLRRLMLIGGNSMHYVTESRQQGFLKAHEEKGIFIDPSQILMEVWDYQKAHRAVEYALAQGADGIVCMDDTICQMVLGCLREKGVEVPVMMKVASLYDSPQMEHNLPPVTSLCFDTRGLGKNACRQMLRMLGEELTDEMEPLNYQVILRESTK